MNPKTSAKWELGLFLILVLSFLVVAAFTACIMVADIEPAYCQEMRALNPDWQFHYDDTTGCRVMYQGFWILVDDLPEALRGGE